MKNITVTDYTSGGMAEEWGRRERRIGPFKFNKGLENPQTGCRHIKKATLT